MLEAPLIAADTNVLLDYAEEDESVIDCFDLLHRRLPGSSVLVLPTVLHEMADLADEGDTDRVRQAARAALGRLLRPWSFRPVNCIPVGHGIVERIGQTLRDKGLIPVEQINDSYVVAEAGLLNVSILLSSDSHLKDIPHAELRLVMDAADVRTPLIASPWKIVHQFFR
jgi:predicted nucleic acid-binding protein